MTELCNNFLTIRDLFSIKFSDIFKRLRRKVTDKDIEETMKNVRWSPANRGYFRGGGFSSSFSTKGEMPITLVRVNMVDGIGYTMQIAEGWTAELPEKVNRINIEDKDVYRPHCRSAFGTKDLESADYRACAFYLDYPCVFLVEFCDKFIWFNSAPMLLIEGYGESF